MTYLDSIDPSIDRRPNCPITYTHSSPSFDPFDATAIASQGSWITVKLKAALMNVPGTYVLPIVGTAHGNSVTKTITITLEIIDICVAKAATSSLALNLASTP